MRPRLFSFLIPFAFASLEVAAAPCTPIRLDGPGGSMEHVPVLDQDGWPMCYSYTAAQMVDAWRFSHGDRRIQVHVSPIATALETGIRQHRDEVKDTGGYVCDVAGYLRRHRACDQALIRDGVNSRNLSAVVDRIREIYYEYRQVAEANRDGIFAPTDFIGDVVPNRVRIAARRDAAQRIVRCAHDAQMSRFLPDQDTIEKLLDETNRLAFFDGFLSEACPESSRFRVEIPSCEKRARSRWRREILTIVDDRLAKPNPQPVAVGYCSHVLTKGRSYRGLNDGRCAEKDMHASLVIGRRPNPTTGKCEYLIRNTWGTGCQYYHPDWRAQCERGNVWIEAEAFGPNLHDAGYLD